MTYQKILEQCKTQLSQDETLQLIRDLFHLLDSEHTEEFDWIFRDEDEAGA